MIDRYIEKTKRLAQMAVLTVVFLAILVLTTIYLD
jgi:hypothetical protein